MNQSENRFYRNKEDEELAKYEQALILEALKDSHAILTKVFERGSMSPLAQRAFDARIKTAAAIRIMEKEAPNA